MHAFPSLHALPLAFAGLEQIPVDVSHVPATWHWSEAVHTTGLLPTHTPIWQLSLRVQRLPSLHTVPLALTGLEHMPLDGSQVPATWH